MKVLVVTLLALLAVVSSRNIDVEEVTDLEDLSAYDYHNKIGIPLANAIREAEAQQTGNRITGGSAAALGQFPYQVGLVIDLPAGQGVCGGVIIDPRIVLTAAHCWFDGRNQASRFTVVAGSLTLFSGGQRLPTSDVEMHALWNPSLIRDDVAIARLDNTPIALSNVANSIALPSGNELYEDFVGWTATASGYGRTGDGLSHLITSNQFLSHVDLPIITNTQCARSFPNNVVASNICTSGANSRSVCGGDSGGPLAVTSNNRRILAGIVSFGSIFGCTRGFPAAFVRITSYVSWINERLN